MHKDHGQRAQSQRGILAFKLEVCDTMYFVGPAAGLPKKRISHGTLYSSIFDFSQINWMANLTKPSTPVEGKENLCKTHQSVSSACSGGSMLLLGSVLNRIKDGCSQLCFSMWLLRQLSRQVQHDPTWEQQLSDQSQSLNLAQSSDPCLWLAGGTHQETKHLSRQGSQ